MRNDVKGLLARPYLLQSYIPSPITGIHSEQIRVTACRYTAFQRWRIGVGAGAIKYTNNRQKNKETGQQSKLHSLC